MKSSPRVKQMNSVRIPIITHDEVGLNYAADPLKPIAMFIGYCLPDVSNNVVYIPQTDGGPIRVFRK